MTMHPAAPAPMKLRCRGAGVLSWVLAVGALVAGVLHVRSAEVDITPDRPVALSGSYGTRISPAPATPIVAAALAIESPREGGVGEHVLFVTCALVAIRDGVQRMILQRYENADREPPYRVGPEDGQVHMERSVAAIGRLWP